MSPSRHLRARQRQKGGPSVSATARLPAGYGTQGLRSQSLRHNAVSKQRGQVNQRRKGYSPLDQHTDEVRILILHPGVGLDQLRCTLETCQLDSCETFEALSYAWGNPTPVEPILVNGSRTLIAHNLSVALRHLRFPQSCRVLWVDAICINQKDIGERNHQVFMMNRLYLAAERVLVWLGEARDRGGIAMKRLKELAEGQEKSANEKIILRRLIYDCLIDRDWWGRLWIVQEVVLAKTDPIMICGLTSLPWSIFMKGFQAADFERIAKSEHHSNRIERINQCSMVNILREYYRARIDLNYSGLPSTSLAFILQHTRDFQATDPRDKIYGCLGLLNKQDREKMKPDYQKPVELVFFEATEHLLKHGGSFFFSVFSISTSRGRLSRKSPSWVPDFSAQRTMSPRNPNLMTRKDGSKLPLYCMATRCVSLQDHNRVLATTGILFDTVEVVVELKDDQELLLGQIPEIEHLTQLATERIALLDNPLYCVDKFKEHQDIFQVLTGGRDGESRFFRSHYEALSGRSKTPSLGSRTPLESETEWNFAVKHIFSGRCFFVTRMGFFGVAVARIRKHGSVTFMFGERLPIILRPRGLSYRMVCAAHISGFMDDDEVTGDMHSGGRLATTTFLIR